MAIQCELCGELVDDVRFVIDEENYNPPRTLTTCVLCKEEHEENKKEIGITDTEVMNGIKELIEGEALSDYFGGGRVDVQSVETFSDAGILTNNKGLVLRMRDGAEFQIEIIQSRFPRVPRDPRR